MLAHIAVQLTRFEAEHTIAARVWFISKFEAFEARISVFRESMNWGIEKDMATGMKSSESCMRAGLLYVLDRLGWPQRETTGAAKLERSKGHHGEFGNFG